MVEKVLKSKCFDLKGVDANGAENAYSFCPYKRVEQYILNPRLTFKLGTFDGWLPSDSAEDKYSAQFYGGGMPAAPPWCAPPLWCSTATPQQKSPR